MARQQERSEGDDRDGHRLKGRTTMSETRKFEASTLEEAIAAAAEYLGVPSDDVHYKLVEEGRRGIFGLGSSPTVIEVEAGGKRAAKPATSKDRRRSGGEDRRHGNASGDRGSDRAATRAAAPEGQDRSDDAMPGAEVEDGHSSLLGGGPDGGRRGRGRRDSRGRSGGRRGGSAPRDDDGNRGARDASRGESDREEGRRLRRRRSRGRRGRGRGARGEAGADGRSRPRGDDAREARDARGSERRSGGRGRRTEREREPVEPPSQELVDRFAASLREMIDQMGLELEAEVSIAGGGVRVDLSGPDSARTLENDGDFLLSLQFVLNRMSRRAWEGIGRIHVTGEGQRNQRDEALMEEVREVAGQVQRTGEAKRLHPMNPYERRLVHLTVREFDGLATESEGDGFLKAVIVSRSEG